MSKTCYVCGAPATSREHCPPQCIFPAGKDVADSVSYRHNLITVPSFDEHNLRKSNDDEYLMMILVSHFGNNDLANQQMKTKVMRAWQRRPHIALTAVQNPQPARINGQETISFAVDLLRFTRAMELITRGLIFHTTGNPWVGFFRVWSPTMLPSRAESASSIMSTSKVIQQEMAKIFANQVFLGENPDVFKYQLHVPVPPEVHGCARLVFYGGFEVAVLFSPTEE